MLGHKSDFQVCFIYCEKFRWPLLKVWDRKLKSLVNACQFKLSTVKEVQQDEIICKSGEAIVSFSDLQHYEKGQALYRERITYLLLSLAAERPQVVLPPHNWP